ncbi:MAG TPA: hypothetical protein VIG88_00850 [Lysobacter sp.]
MSSRAPPSKTSGAPRPRLRDERAGDGRRQRRDERLQSAAGRDAEAGRNAGRASDDTRQATE